MSKTITRALLLAISAGLLCVLCVSSPLLSALTSSPSTPPARPKILGIASVHFYSSNLPRARQFYRDILADATECHWCEKIPTSYSFLLPTGQSIHLTAPPSPSPTDFLADIALLVDNLDQLKRYLSANHVSFQELTAPPSEGGPILSVVDPEGHTLHFITQPALHPISFVGHPQIIHAGIIVKDRTATDHFYKDILGFHLYWQGGFKEGTTNWAAMQVPDGTSWIEYMLNEDTTTQAQRGVMNHVSIGVPSIQAAAAALENAGVHLGPNEKPQMGLDGKWQLNLYDPDLSRVELMEFSPVGKTCCSDFTGPHPKP